MGTPWGRALSCKSLKIDGRYRSPEKEHLYETFKVQVLGVGRHSRLNAGLKFQKR